MSKRRRQLARAADAARGTLRKVGHALMEPLRADPEMELRLSIPETQTTTIDGDVGWADRPPAVLECPECESEIYQHRPTSTIDCPECWFELSDESFPDLNLLYMQCSVCGATMDHGRRHPNRIDVPEWATCDACQYHWELEHF